MTGTIRRRLANRRGNVTFDFICGDFHYVATVSFFSDGKLAEIFIGNGAQGRFKHGQRPKDSAVVASLALQHGIPVDVIRRALLRDFHGVANSPLGCALDLVASQISAS